MASFTASCQPAPSRVTDGYLGTLCPTVPIRTFCTVTELFQGIQRIRNLILFKPGDGQSLMTQPSLEHVMQAWSDSGLAWNTPSPTPTSPKAAAMAPTLMASAQSGQKRQGSVHPPPALPPLGQAQRLSSGMWGGAGALQGQVSPKSRSPRTTCGGC